MIYLERKKGGDAIKQKNFLGFEPEDILYLIIPITFFDKIESFLYAAYIGTQIFLLITLLFTIGLFFSLVSTSLIASDRLDTNSYFFFFKHLIYICIGIFIIFVFSSIRNLI